jgi:hypothetical protein
LREKSGCGGGGGFRLFAGVFEGVLGNTRCSGVVFCGEVVVICVVDVVS